MIAGSDDLPGRASASEAEDWRRRGRERCRRALSGAVSGADRLALLRSLVRLSDGLVDLRVEGLTLASAELDHLARFGLALDGANLRLTANDFDQTIPGFGASIAVDSCAFY